MTARPSAGPWEAEETQDGIFVWGEPGYEGIPDNWREVCCISTYEEEEIDMDRANARLIAAAPSMLAELRANWEAFSKIQDLADRLAECDMDGLQLIREIETITIQRLAATHAVVEIATKATGASEQ